MNYIKLNFCYLITISIISLFLYTLLSSHLTNGKKLETLKAEVDEIAHLVFQRPFHVSGQTKQFTELIDNSIKKRLSGIWDDLYAIKKQIKDNDYKNVLDVKNIDNSHRALTKPMERFNYAAEEVGARVAYVEADPICPTNIIKSWLGIDFSSNPPVNMLKSNMVPGNCFGFRGNKAAVIIKLPKMVLIDQITMSHISRSQSATEDTSSAPKDFQIFGISGSSEEILLGKFTFDNDPLSLIKAFNIQTQNKFQYLRFIFDSNHGHPEYTCIYRIAVHGKLR